MDSYGEVLISTRFRNEDYLSLHINPHDDIGWDTAIRIFDDRIKGRYINPAQELISNVNNNGFAVMAIVCLLIETMYQFTRGIDRTENGNKDKYSNFLIELLRAENCLVSKKVAIQFYDCIRCGILHQGQTKNGSRLSTSDKGVIWVEDDVLFVSVSQLLDVVARYVNDYESRLRDLNNVSLRTNFISKMDYICKRKK